ncbi:hypothetical protein ANTRET_LOCUS4650 [Anthophora retusa]
MGKVGDGVASDITDNERSKSVREEQKIRAKKKKRKRDLTDLHQRFFKSKKNSRITFKFWQSSFIKLLQRFADIREEYERETKIDGKPGKARNSKRIADRILPRPLAGIYRNGATGKEIRRSRIKLSSNDLNNARLQGNVLKLLHGYDPKPDILQPTPPGETRSPVLGKAGGRKNHSNNEYIEIFTALKSIELPQKLSEKEKTIISENLRNSALSKYEELCKITSSKYIEGQNFPGRFTIGIHNSDIFTTNITSFFSFLCFVDPLIAVKRKLRNMYAESFRSHFLRDKIKRGTILDNCDTPSTSVENQHPSEIAYCPSGYSQAADLVSATISNAEYRLNQKKSKGKEDLASSFSTDTKRDEIPASNLLFDLSLLNAPDYRVNTIVEPEMTRGMNNITTQVDSTDINTHVSLEVNNSTSSTYQKHIEYYETIPPANLNELKRIKERSKRVLFVPTEAGLQNNLVDKKHLVRRKNQRTQTVHVLNSGLKRHSGKQGVKVSQQVKMKNLKHIPTILRRCTNVAASNNNRLNLFQESMYINKGPREMLFEDASKRPVLFTPQSLITESSDSAKRLQTSDTVNTMFGAADVQTCVIASPSTRKDEGSFVKNSRFQSITDTKQNVHVNDIFLTKKNPQMQKTVMFTKKDARNIDHCLHLNNLIADGIVDNPNVCIIRKNVPVQQEKLGKNVCTVHKNCHRVPESSYKALHCSQSSDSFNYGSSQEYKEVSQIQNIHQLRQKPMVCEKVLLRRVQQRPKCESNQKCHNDQNICYVVVDPCKDLNNTRECSNDGVPQIEKSRTLQDGYFYQEDMADVGILKGVQNLKILPGEERESQVKYTNSQCMENAVVLEEQPIKYLAVENNSKTQKIPIYVQKNKHVPSVDNVGVVNPNVNYHMVSYPRENAQEVIFMPTCEQNRVVYVKQQNLGRSEVSFEKCSPPRKIVLYRPEVQRVKESSNLCEIYVPKQNVVEIRKNECDAVVTNLQQEDNMKKSRRSGVNWEELHYRPSYERQPVNDARSQAIFYHK